MQYIHLLLSIPIIMVSILVSLQHLATSEYTHCLSLSWCNIHSRWNSCSSLPSISWITICQFRMVSCRKQQNLYKCSPFCLFILNNLMMMPVQLSLMWPNLFLPRSHSLVLEGGISLVMQNQSSHWFVSL